MFKSKKQLLLRFLKQNGLFNSDFFKRFSNHLKESTTISISYFDNICSWRGTKEGHSFWLKIQCEFILFVIENDKNNNFFSKYSIYRYFTKIIKSGYFSETSMNKQSSYYLGLCEKYEEYSKNFI